MAGANVLTAGEVATRSVRTPAATVSPAARTIGENVAMARRAAEQPGLAVEQLAAHAREEVDDVVGGHTDHEGDHEGLEVGRDVDPVPRAGDPRDPGDQHVRDPGGAERQQRRDHRRNASPTMSTTATTETTSSTGSAPFTSRVCS